MSRVQFLEKEIKYCILFNMSGQHNNFSKCVSIRVSLVLVQVGLFFMAVFMDINQVGSCGYFQDQ